MTALSEIPQLCLGFSWSSQHSLPLRVATTVPDSSINSSRTRKVYREAVYREAERVRFLEAFERLVEDPQLWAP